MNHIDNFEVNLTLTVAEINGILASIQDLPARVANPLTEKIKAQAVPQLPQPDAPKETTEAAE